MDKELKIVDWNWYRLNGFVWTGWFFWIFDTGMVIRSEVPSRQANGLFQPVELAMFNSEKILLEPEKQVGLLPQFEKPLASVGLKEGSCNDWEINIPDENRELFLKHLRFLQNYWEHKWDNREPFSSSYPHRKYTTSKISDFRSGDFSKIPEEIETKFLGFRFSVVLEEKET